MKLLRYGLIAFIFILAFAVSCQATKAPEGDIREPVVAGKFYPSSPSKLRLAIEKFLHDAVPQKVKNPLAIIVPHAGYIFSGQICADAFKQVSNQHYDVVVILGTNHTNPDFRKISIYPGGGFKTPLGVAPIDKNVVSSLMSANPEDCTEDKSLHEDEHSVEVVVPFVQVLFPKARIVPIVVGTPDVRLCSRFGQALAGVLKNRRALIVASSDLSHYPDREAANAVDRKTLETIIKLNPALLHATLESQMKRRIPHLSTCACGEAPIMAAITAAKSLGATRGVIVSYMNSGDVPIGDRSRVVGYGAVAMTAEGDGENVSGSDQSPASPTTGSLQPADKKALLVFARETISRVFFTDTIPIARGFTPNLQQPRGVFVTLKKKGELRGCIGRIIADEPLCKLVGAMAIAAALSDRRFTPVTADELEEITIEISVLTPLKEVSDASEIVTGRDGVLLRKDGHSAVFLPQVATEQGWTREEMLDHLCLKADLKAGSWKQGAQLLTFQAIVFSEAEFK
ncbi:MAG: AmmeMemoRadiSam system protein B [Deltaproteobacteria bacterium]|nr:AmmeMemoRadiSam system protein B [Deltaproteobacteria bacterium]